MNGFLPISKQDMADRGWYYCDFLIVTGDAYVDHPSFGTAIISRVLEDAATRSLSSASRISAMSTIFSRWAVRAMRYSSTAATSTRWSRITPRRKKRRSDDAYTPGGVGGKRPDRAVTVYSMLARRAFRKRRSISAALKPVCADLRTTITGLTVLCRPFWNPPARTA